MYNEKPSHALTESSMKQDHVCPSTAVPRAYVDFFQPTENVYFDDLQRIFKGFRIHGIYFADEVMK
jgi:hypothetical protein